MIVPVNEPLLNNQAVNYVHECMTTNWISSHGHFIEDFEKSWARYCSMPYGVAVSNGTNALELALACLDLPPQSEIIMPAFTIISCAIAAVRSRAVPALVDCDPKTWCMDVRLVEDKITPHTRAIMPVHIYGHPVDMDPLRNLADKYGLYIIEDAAEAHGAEYKGQKVGGIGDLSCFSFYANKIITTGEGGMVLTKSLDHAERIRSLRNLCFVKDQRFLHAELGHNYRMTNIQAAIGLAQIEQIDEHVRRKRWMGQKYSERLKGLDRISLPVEETWAKNVYWMYGIILSDDVPFEAEEFAQRLNAEGVQTRPFFLGLHEQPALQQLGFYKGESYPVTERISRRGLYIPSGLTITEQEIDYVCNAISKVLV